MRRIKFLLKKEFKQIFRNKSMLPLIFVMPVIQPIILVNAATFEIKRIDIAVLDQDHSQTSKSIVNKFLSTGYYQMAGHVTTLKDGQLLMDQNKIDLLIQFPPKFESDLQRENKAVIMLDVIAIDGSAASIMYYFTNTIIFDFNRSLVQKWQNLPTNLPLPVKVEIRYWFNEELEY